MEDRRPTGRVELRFQDHRTLKHVSDPIAKDLSAAALWRGSLFLSCDETASVERLTETTPGVWGAHAHISLGGLVDLPDGPAGEMDIEGLDCDDGWLWVLGSHALKRRKAKSEPPEAALAEMERVAREPNRYFLGRFPLAAGANGFEPVAQTEGRRAAHLAIGRRKSKLVKWMRGDPHLDPFLDLPSKENGLDIEGIAARGLRVWLGLRGPVLRGFGVVLELELRVTAAGRLGARRIDFERRYRKHLLDTGGLGIRDIKLDGDDMLVLAGPTLATEGPARVLRWRDAVRCTTSGLRRDVERALELPYHGPVDHPEGIVRWGEDWLVVNDSPSEARIEGDGAVVAADIWAIPRPLTKTEIRSGNKNRSKK